MAAPKRKDKETTFRRIVAAEAGAENRRRKKAGKKKVSTKQLEGLAKGRISEMVRARDRRK